MRVFEGCARFIRGRRKILRKAGVTGSGVRTGDDACDPLTMSAWNQTFGCIIRPAGQLIVHPPNDEFQPHYRSPARSD